MAAVVLAALVVAADWAAAAQEEQGVAAQGNLVGQARRAEPAAQGGVEARAETQIIHHHDVDETALAVRTALVDKMVSPARRARMAKTATQRQTIPRHALAVVDWAAALEELVAEQGVAPEELAARAGQGAPVERGAEQAGTPMIQHLGVDEMALAVKMVSPARRALAAPADAVGVAADSVSAAARPRTCSIASRSIVSIVTPAR